MNTTTYDSETLADLASDYITEAIVGDGPDRTNAVGLLAEDGSLVRTVQDPDLITALALRMIVIADEIRSDLSCSADDAYDSADS